MILIGDDDRVAGLSACAKRLRQDIGVGVVEGPNATRLSPTPSIAASRSRASSISAPPVRELRRAIGLDLALAVEPGQPVDDLPAGIGAARILEMRDLRQGGLGKGRELCPHKLRI